MTEPLVLVPTPLERDLGLTTSAIESTRVRVIGFGPVAAAARSAHWLGVEKPASVVLFGIAGTYDEERLPVGTARAFDQVVLAEIGAGPANDRIGLDQLGFAQWTSAELAIYDRLDLSRDAPPRPTDRTRDGLLLTVLSASGDPAHASSRRSAYPDALAEDMEAFGVALACACAGVPLTVIRGISNVAGDREKSRWRIDDALAAAQEFLLATFR